MTVEPSPLLVETLNAVFGSLRAEYLNDDIYDLFTAPTYWPELLTVRPCVLVGGRGTGKTTVLRSLSYEGQARLNTGPILESWPFVGTYWRADTNVVTAFRGAGLDEAQWSNLFGHYLNLIFVARILQFCYWGQQHGVEGLLSKEGARRTAMSLNLPEADSLGVLIDAVEDAVIGFEAFVNNASAAATPMLSMQGKPVETLVTELVKDGRLQGRTFCILIDEFENLQDYQQRIVNTLLKHSSDVLSYKIGVKTTGYRQHATLNPSEQVMEPADFALIDISPSLLSNGFGDFAEHICNARLSRLALISSLERSPGIRELLPELSESQEAQLLGVESVAAEARQQAERDGATAAELDAMVVLSDLEQALIAYWAEAKSTDVATQLRDRIAKPEQWFNRQNNYQYAMLFTLRRGKRGIRKHYAGWNTFVDLADGNIRFLLFLVNASIQLHLQNHGRLDAPIQPKHQTAAAQDVGKRIVQQLQGLAAEGAQLTRLVLSLGRVFGVMASQPHGHAPEVNQFRVRWSQDNPEANDAAQLLLSAAVMHLAVVRFPGDKAAGASAETKDYDYALHPIFAAFFDFSHRSKRRTTITATDLLSLTNDPARGIRRVLAGNHRALDDELPEQLDLFRGFYG